MTPEEIKNILGVDITTKKRDIHLVYFRSLVANEMRKNNYCLRVIANEFNRNHASIINILNNLIVYKKDPLFKYIELAYKEKDKMYLDKYFALLRLKKITQNREVQNTFQKTTIKQHFKEEKKVKYFKKPTILEVSKNLRNKSTYLNNKHFNKWNETDLKNYYKLISNETSIKI
jgi:hypothetical protein